MIAPDVVICFWHTAGIQSLTSLKYPAGNSVVFYWLPWEGSTLPEGDSNDYFKRVESKRIVHLSEYARKLWATSTSPSEVIPHGVDPAHFSILDSDSSKISKELRSKWTVRLNVHLSADDILILSVDRNIWHKRWDATFDFVRKLQDKTEKRVKLLAHCRRVEKSPRPIHGYSLPKLESAYGLQKGTVIYTNFDWMRGLTREEVAELYKMSDLRISTSQGEGFGIPTVEAAMCGCLQVVNDTTTMPELFPADSICRVPPAMSECKEGVLYQVPNVNEMVTRASHILFQLNEKERDVLRAANQRHALKFSAEKVVTKWLDLFEIEDVCGQWEDRWYDYRDGYNTNFQVDRDDFHVSKLLLKFGPNPRVLQLGSFTGKFIDSCLVDGLFVKGIEPDEKAVSRCSTKAKLLTTHGPILEDWPETDIIVVTDFLSLYDRAEAKEVLMRAAKSSKWIVLRMQPIYKRGTPTNDLCWVPKFLTNLGAGRREDLEKVAVSKWYKELTHEIWQTEESWEEMLIPEGFNNA